MLDSKTIPDWNQAISLPGLPMFTRYPRSSVTVRRKSFSCGSCKSERKIANVHTKRNNFKKALATSYFFTPLIQAIMMAKGGAPKFSNLSEKEKFQCLGHSNWTICSLLSQFCSLNFPIFSSFILRANSYYPREGTAENGIKGIVPT